LKPTVESHWTKVHRNELQTVKIYQYLRFDLGIDEEIYRIATEKYLPSDLDLFDLDLVF